MLTVRDLVAGLDLRLLCGEAADTMPVRWVHISEIPDPTPWLSGGEVLLTTGLPLTDRETQRSYVHRLADHQIAALGFGTGFTHAEVPPTLLEAARKRDLPVFEVPYELPFIAITEAAFTRLVNEQYAVLRQALAGQERLERIVLSERGLEALTAGLSSLLGATVLVLNPRGESLARHAFRREPDTPIFQLLQAQVRERSARLDTRNFLPALPDGSSGMALPVIEAGDSAGDGGASLRAAAAWVVAIKDAGPLSDFDRLTLNQAVNLIALELLRARVAGDTERRLAGDVVAALCQGSLAGPELARRLEPFGLGASVATLVVQGRGQEGRRHVEGSLRAALQPEFEHALVAAAGEVVCAVVSAPPAEDDLLASGRRAAERLALLLGEPVALGLGRMVAAGEARRSFLEACCALESLSLSRSGGSAASSGGGPRGGAGPAPAGVRVASYRDIGSFQLLLALQDAEALRLFCDGILAPLEEGEGAYGDELIRSLEAFIEENGQWERAARRLYCHRHTLRYRIRRVEELTGRDLTSARDRVDLWLALRGRELVR